jgi:hypothetical protein
MAGPAPLAARRDPAAPHVIIVGLALAAGLAWTATLLAGDAALPVVHPMLAMLAVSGIAAAALWDRRRGGAPFEIGAVYVAVVAVYTLYPLLAFLVNGLRISPTGEGRLAQHQPGAAELGLIGWYHVVHAAAFVVVYLVARGRGAGRALPRLSVSRPTLITALVLYVTIQGTLYAVTIAYDLTASTYAETYLLSRRLPLFLAQATNHLSGIQFVLQLVLLAALFADYRRYRFLIAGWLVVQAASTVIRLGTRTELVLLVLAAVLMYHHAVRPIGLVPVAGAGALGLVVFNAIGHLRAGGWSAADAGGVHPVFGYSSEFEVIFGNAWDLRRLRLAGEIGELPATFHIADLVSIVPQQLSPFTKVDPSTWYVTTFYPDYAARGGAFVFGTIAQSVLGGGWLDLVARGAALGLMLALVHRRWRRRPAGPWAFVFYIWATVLVYQSYRNMTFSLLNHFVFRFVPAWVAVIVLGAMWTRTPRHDRG